jgi:hypothetical protein
MTVARLALMLFLVTQICDGIFTLVAVQSSGIIAEGNVLLATWMGLVGAVPALIGAKLLAAGCGVLLYLLGVHRVLTGLTIYYGVFAISPWLVAFHTWP